MAKLSDISTVCRKEVLYIVRDSRTLILTALIPIVLMPMFLLAPHMMAHKTMHDVESATSTIALSPDNAFVRSQISKHSGLEFASASAEPDRDVRSGKVDVWLEPPPDLDAKMKQLLPRDQQPVISARYDGRHLNGFLSEHKVVAALIEARDQIKKQRLASLNVPEPADLLKIDWKTVPLNRRAEAQGLVPISVPGALLFIILVALMYPSLDLITGERERGTMSLLLVSCAEHTDIMLGKMLAVSTLGQSSVLLGMTSLFVTLSVFLARNPESHRLLSAITPFAFVGTLILAIPLVLLFACLSFLLAGMCKTFQQGQGYFLPFALLTMLPAGICSMPGIHLDTPVVVLPVCNMMVAMRDVIAGNFDPVWVCAAWIVSMFYALGAARYTIRLLDREAEVNEGTTPAAVRRRRGDYRFEAGLLLAVCFLLMFYGGQIAQAQDALTGVLLSQLLCILGPAFGCLALLQLSLKKTMSLCAPKPAYLLAALLLSPAVAAVSMGIGAIQALFLPVPESYAKAFLDVVIQPGRPFWLIVAVFALAPAICEELLFRGAILGLLRRKFSPAALAIVVGVAFGLFHLSSFRFLPTATMGVVLSILTILSGSIFPSMLLHGLHNTILIAFEYFKVHDLSVTEMAGSLVSGTLGILLILAVRKGNKADVRG